MVRNLFLIALCLIVSEVSASAAETGKIPVPQVAPSTEPTKPSYASSSESSGSPLHGPALHLSTGFRIKKAPNIDEYYSAYGGFKLSALSVDMGEMYASFLAVGVYIQKSNLFAASLSPVIVNIKYGIGLSFDFFPVDSVRTDRPGGPFGISLNIDLMRISGLVSSALRK